jgi:hypothetical protein
MSNYKITYQQRGETKTHYFSSLEAAIKVASEVFDRTGIVLGIERTDARLSRSFKGWAIVGPPFFFSPNNGGQQMTGKEKERLTRMVRRFILEHGGIDTEGTLFLETTAGTLAINPMGDWIAGRFLDVERAKQVLPHRAFTDRLSPSGKWNFHYGRMKSPFEALFIFEGEVNKLLKPEEYNV